MTKPQLVNFSNEFYELQLIRNSKETNPLCLNCPVLLDYLYRLQLLPKIRSRRRSWSVSPNSLSSVLTSLFGSYPFLVSASPPSFWPPFLFLWCPLRTFLVKRAFVWVSRVSLLELEERNFSEWNCWSVRDGFGSSVPNRFWRRWHKSFRKLVQSPQCQGVLGSRRQPTPRPCLRLSKRRTSEVLLFE